MNSDVEVWRARLDKDDVVFKFDPHSSRVIRGEVNALLTLKDGPHIVQMLGYYDHHRGEGFTLEVAEMDLEQAQKKGLATFCNLHTWFRQLFTAIGFCHAHGVIHADVKPGNLLLFEGQTLLKLADFDISAREGVARDYLITTAPFRAPEAFWAETYPWGPPVDIWSAGASLYTLAVGDFPFGVNPGTPVLIYEKLGVPPGVKIAGARATQYPELGTPLLPPEGHEARRLPPGFLTLINQTMNVESEKRPTATEARALLGAALDQGGVSQ